MTNINNDSSSSCISSDDDDDEMILEGVLVRNRQVPSSSEDESSNQEGDDDHEKDEEEEEIEEDKKSSQKHKLSLSSRKPASIKSKKPKKEESSSDDDDDDLVHVEFTFHDMDEKFWHGLKMLLLSVPIYAPVSSALADEMIENISVGTVVSCDDDENVYGFASVLPIQKARNNMAQDLLIQLCLDQCPEQYKDEMNIVTSGSTSRPAGIFIHGRMVNLPLEISLILHEQLVLDMDWAVENAEGEEAERKKLDFGAFILLAPCCIESNTNKISYNNFDDEIFASCAEFVYPIHAHTNTKTPQSKNRGDDNGVTNVVVVLTKTGHRQAMKELQKQTHARPLGMVKYALVNLYKSESCLAEISDAQIETRIDLFKKRYNMASTSTSILSLLPKASLTSSGLIDLDRDSEEVELMVITDVALRDANDHHSHKSLVIPMATLTNHRLVFYIDTNCHNAVYLHLGKIVKTEASALTLLSLTSSPYIILHSSNNTSYALVFRHKRDRDRWIGSLDKAIERRGWENKTSQNSKEGCKARSSVGVDAIITSNRLKHEYAQRLANDAFQVENNARASKRTLSKQEKQLLVDKLFMEATELVNIIQKYTATIENHNRKLILQQQQSTDAVEHEDDYGEPINQLVEMLQDMGMTTALSKTSLRDSPYQATDFYYSTLARQLADFLRYRDRLLNAGGMLALTDIYCYFNRARGIHTVSPQDFLHACTLCRSLALGISLREFQSGFLVLQDDKLMNDTALIQNIYNLLWSKQDFPIDCTVDGCIRLKPLSSMDICRAFNLSPLLAQELLQIVEKAGYLSRDYTIAQGILFYPNCFVSSTTLYSTTFQRL